MTRESSLDKKLTFGPTIALVVVDVQNDFAHVDGSLFVDGGDEVIGVVNSLIADAKTAGSLVIYTQDWHPTETPHFADFGGIWPTHCVADTWGAELCQNLIVDGPTVRKGTDGQDGYSGFTMRDPLSGETQVTGLNDLLVEHSIESVVVVGLALDVCVKATALDAVGNGYTVKAPANASASVNLNEGDHEAALAELVAAGVDVG